MQELKFTFKNLDKPNRNNHLYTKECIDKAINDPIIMEKIATNTLFLLSEPSNLAPIDLSAVIGTIKLENKYPEMVGSVVYKGNINLNKQYCCLEAVANEAHEEDGITVIDDMEIVDFFVADDCAFEYAILDDKLKG